MENAGTILITGATGLLGTHLVKRLSKTYAPHQLRALSKSGRQVEGAEAFACDILDVVGLEQAMQGVDKVYHCAAVVSFDPASRQALQNINMNGTANVVNACIDAGVKKLLHVSSVAAIGKNKHAVPADENTPFNEKEASLYGITKHAAEMHVWRGFAEGLNTVVVNPSIILGAGDWHQGSAQLFKNVYEEFPYYTQGVHGYVDVEDVAAAMVRLMEADISGERFILNGANTSFEELFTMIADAFGKKPPSKKATPFMSEIVWRLSFLQAKIKGKKPLLTRETAHSAQEKALYDSSKVLAALPGFAFTPLRSTIKRVAEELSTKYGLT